MSTPTTNPSADWSGLDDARRLAREAATVAYAIGAGYESSEPVILRANDYLDVRGAVAAALDAIQFPHVEYNTVELAAHYSIRGAHLDEGTTDGKLTDALRGGLNRAVITIAADYQVDDLTMIPVIGQIGREVDDALEEALEIYSIDKIFIIVEPKASE